MTQIGTPDRERRCIGTVKVDVVTRGAATDRIVASAVAQRPLMVAFANAHSVNLARHDVNFAAAMNEALVLNDGVGVDLASRWLFGRPFPDNLNGTDFVPALIAAAREPLRLFLIGGRPGTARRAGEILASRHPEVALVGAISGYFSHKDEAEHLRQIAESGANLVLLAMGQPLQERWAQRHWRSIGGPCICVGALLDFLAGNVPRAPSALRRLRLEWAFRLVNEPRRLAQRYLVGNVAFLAMVIRSPRRTKSERGVSN